MLINSINEENDNHNNKIAQSNFGTAVSLPLVADPFIAAMHNCSTIFAR